MTSAEFVKALACLVAWREERSNGYNGMLGVLFCLSNRSKLGPEYGFSTDWAVNIEKHNQFSSMSVVGDSQTVVYPDVRDPLFIRLLQDVDAIFDQTAIDKVSNGGVYYADLMSSGFSQHGWFATEILGHSDRYPRVAQIGSTTYFGVKK